jgi:hypothetical protein
MIGRAGDVGALRPLRDSCDGCDVNSMEDRYDCEWKLLKVMLVKATV